MNPVFDLCSPSRTLIGPGSSKRTGAAVAEYGLRRILLVTDGGLKSTNIPGELIAQLSDMCEVLEIADLPREPSDGDVDRVVGEARSFRPDAVLAVGGGSVLDVGKLCSVLLETDLRTIDLLDGAPVPRHAGFSILVPTTAGTGAEATKNAIIAIPTRNTKAAVVHQRLLPDLVILDPELTLTLPRSMTATTGMDALCHAIECFLSRKANAMSDLLAIESVGRIARSLRSAVDDGGNIDARFDMLLASYYAGMCITLSGTNAVHALSYPLGARYHVPHGQANAMLLPFVMERNLSAIPAKTEALARCFGFKGHGNGRDAEQFMAAQLHGLVGSLGISTSLSDFGVPKDDVDLLTESAVAIRRLMDNNPVELGSDDVKSIYLRLFESAP